MGSGAPHHPLLRAIRHGSLDAARHRVFQPIRRSVRRGVVLAALCCLVASPSALAQGGATNPLAPQGPSNPFAPGLPQQPTVQTATTPTILTPTTATSGSSSLSSGDAVAIGIGALVVLAGISFFIWRDARRRAPVRHRAATATAGAGGRQGAKVRTKPRKLSPAERRRRKRGRAR